MKMKTERLMSLDVLRGITVAGMILVNNPGDWGYIYAPLKHAEWNGLTPTDLVFPFFMFVMGVSMSFSLRKFDYRPTRDFLVKLVRRTAVLFLLGVALSWVSLVLSRWLSPGSTMSWSQILFPFEQVRVWGVLQRLALSYFFASLLVVTVRNRRILGYIVVGILLVYGFILTLGHGFELSTANVIAVVDRAVVGENHMYLEWLPDGGRISFDPEGLVSTLPGIAHVLIGFFCGRLLMSSKPLNDKMVHLAVVCAVLLIVGFLLGYGWPVNKKVWSPSYVLVTCGFAMLTLIVLIWVLDMRNRQRWAYPFRAFGCNPLFIYVFASFLAIVLETIPCGGLSVKEQLYEWIAGWVVVPQLASLIYALAYVAFNGLLACVLLQKKIFIKV